MLENILGTKSKIRILREFIRNIERDYSMEDLVKATGMSFGTVHPALNGLVDSRILTARKFGRSKMYRINKAHVLFPQIEKLLRKEAMVLTEIATEFAENLGKEGIENIILFGSVARGEVTGTGDIDILIIYFESDITERIGRLAGEFLEKYDVVISPICLSKEEIKKRLKKFDDFILRAIDEGKVLYGDDTWLRK